MRTILNISVKDEEVSYNKYSKITKFTDKFKIKETGQVFLKEVGVNIRKVVLPSNFNKEAYLYNLNNARKKVKAMDTILSPKIIRVYDFDVLSSFQKNIFAYGVFKSLQLLLRTTNRSIKSSTIVIHDAKDIIAREVIYELAKNARHLILVSRDLKKILALRDYIIANFGISPEVTWDLDYAVRIADFIVSTKSQSYDNGNVWYIDNRFIPEENKSIIVNDFTFKVPWNSEFEHMSPELLGGILNGPSNKDVGEILDYNGINLYNILFNKREIQV